LGLFHRILLESDYQAIAERVGSEANEVPLAEQTVTQVFQSAKSTFESLLK
jgi:hypothetical protein